MAKKTNPKLIGGFVVGAIALAIAGALAFGGGQFLKPKGEFVVFFQGNLSGLDVGSPVTFRGVKVGSVTSIVIKYDVDKQVLRIPVRCELETEKFQVTSGERSTKNIGELVKRGLRAQLETVSLVTGQTSINFDFHPDTPIRLVGAEPGIPELPTIPSDIDLLKSNVTDVLAKISKLPLDQLTGQMLETMKSTNALIANVNAQVAPLVGSVTGTSDQASALLKEAQARLQLREGEPLQELNDTLGDARKLLATANGNLPTLVDAAESALKTASGTLAQTDRTLSAAQRSISPDSPLYFELNNTLREIKGAATAIKVFAEYLQRNPNALLTGNH